jgi:hypothetical protein
MLLLYCVVRFGDDLTLNFYPTTITDNEIDVPVRNVSVLCSAYIPLVFAHPLVLDWLFLLKKK